MPAGEGEDEGGGQGIDVGLRIEVADGGILLGRGVPLGAVRCRHGPRLHVVVAEVYGVVEVEQDGYLGAVLHLEAYVARRYVGVDHVLRMQCAHGVEYGCENLAGLLERQRAVGLDILVERLAPEVYSGRKTNIFYT